MPRKLKGVAALEGAGRILKKLFPNAFFTMNVFNEDRDGLHFHFVTNLPPAVGRSFAQKALVPGQKIEQTARFIHEDGHIDILTPAASQQRIDADKAAVAAPMPTPEALRREAGRIQVVGAGAAGLPDLRPQQGKKIYIQGKGWVQT